MATSSCFHGQQMGSSQTTECSHHVAEAPLTLCWQQTATVSLVSFTHTHINISSSHTLIFFSQLTPSSPHMNPPHTPSTSHTLTHTILTSHVPSSPYMYPLHAPSSCTLILTHPHAHTLLTSHISSSHTHILTYPPAHTLLTSHVPSSCTLTLFS